LQHGEELNPRELAGTLVTTTSHRFRGRRRWRSRSRGGGKGREASDPNPSSPTFVEAIVVVVVSRCMEVRERGRESREGGRHALPAGSCRCRPYSGGIEAHKGHCGGRDIGREGRVAHRPLRGGEHADEQPRRAWHRQAGGGGRSGRAMPRRRATENGAGNAQVVCVEKKKERR